MAENIDRLLESSRDSRALLDAALTLARSARSTDLDLLMESLQSRSFLDRLDPDPEELRGFLRVGHVLEALAENPVPKARELIVRLTQTPVFHDLPDRADRLIQVSAIVRPAPPEVVRFWESHCQPNDSFTPLTISAIVENGTSLALSLLETKMADASHARGEKLAWMRSDILEHRNDVPLLNSCYRMLQGGLAQDLRLALVEVLFDYRPGEWYCEHSVQNPPDRSQASPAAAALLHQIGTYALASFPLTEQQKNAIEQTLEDLEKPRGN